MTRRQPACGACRPRCRPRPTGSRPRPCCSCRPPAPRAGARSRAPPSRCAARAVPRFRGCEWRAARAARCPRRAGGRARWPAPRSPARGRRWPTTAPRATLVHALKLRGALRADRRDGRADGGHGAARPARAGLRARPRARRAGAPASARIRPRGAPGGGRRGPRRSRGEPVPAARGPRAATGRAPGGRPAWSAGACEWRCPASRRGARCSSTTSSRRAPRARVRRRVTRRRVRCRIGGCLRAGVELVANDRYFP